MFRFEQIDQDAHDRSHTSQFPDMRRREAWGTKSRTVDRFWIWSAREAHT